MAIEFKLPDLGEGVEDADVLRVLVTEGQEIAVDQSVLEIETEKATVEVPSTAAGRVTRVLVAPGDTIKPGQLILLVEAAGSAAAPADAAPAAPAAPPAAAPTTAEAPPATALAATTPATAAPPASAPTAAPITATAPATPAAPASPAAPAAEAAAPRAEDDASPVAAPDAPGDHPIFASPALRKFAREIGVDLSEVQGTGPGGRITEEDVKRHARSRSVVPEPTASAATGTAVWPPPPPPLPDFSQWGEIERQPLSRLRRTVARNLAISWSQIPHVTLQHWADITEIEAMRQQYKDRARQAGGNLTISVVMIKIVAAALKAHPKFNSSLDLESNELILKRYYNIGVAVDTERGLVVPVIRDVNEKNIVELSIELNALGEKARKNELGLDDMRGATFTVSNLGSLGTGHFSPIVNYPEVAVLGLGRAEQTPTWENGEWKARLRMPLSITFDHRVIDGADGARFLSWITEAVAQPLLLALEG